MRLLSTEEPKPQGGPPQDPIPAHTLHFEPVDSLFCLSQFEQTFVTCSPECVLDHVPADPT